MADASNAYYVARGRDSAMISDSAPDFLWGTGTPNGDVEPFVSAQKGTLYAAVDQTDDGPIVWMKVDEGGDNADWKELGGPSYVWSEEFNIDNGAGTTEDDILIIPDRAIHVISARIVYTEATGSGNAEGSNIKLGTAVGGAQIVAATSHASSKAVGSYTDLTLASTAISANGMLAARHTGVASTVTGKYRVQVEFI